MNRTFHARIIAPYRFFLLLVGLLVFYNLWMKHVLLSLLFVVWLLVLIERLIHTTYTLTSDGRLLLYYGRFARQKEIKLAEITSVERAGALRVGGRALTHCVLVKYGKGERCEALFPVGEADFIRALQKAIGPEVRL